MIDNLLQTPALSLSPSLRADGGQARPARAQRAARRGQGRPGRGQGGGGGQQPAMGCRMGPVGPDVGEWVFPLLNSQLPSYKIPRSRSIDWMKLFFLSYSCICSLLIHDF